MQDDQSMEIDLKYQVTTKWLGLFFLSSLMISCSKAPTIKSPPKSYTVHMLKMHKTLHFTGHLQPLREMTLTSPMEAVIEEIRCHYGEPVKKGQIIFVLNSAELQRTYNETLTDYLKAKDSYGMAEAKFIGTNELWKAGILSKNNYLNEESSLINARITLMQEFIKLKQLFEKTAEGQFKDLSTLSLAEFEKVRLALTRQHNLIYIKAPSDGVLLYPPKSESDTGGPVAPGMSLKAGEVLGMVGDLSGLRVQIDVPEIDIRELKLGLPATIRGVAFGPQTLQGRLVSINAQATIQGAGGLPSFIATIEVPTLNQEQQAWIKVGMSSEIELKVESMDKILVPIAAIKPHSGHNTVKILAANGKLKIRSVITGVVDADKVVIDAGLDVGDVVMYE